MMRFEAIKRVLQRTAKKSKLDLPNRSDLFGINALAIDSFHNKVSKKTFFAMMNLLSLQHKTSLPKENALEFANAVKDWAVSRGAKHFCHWFQPLNGLPAAKYDSFLNTQVSETRQTVAVGHFDPAAFIQAEGDASSLPHGGTRNTAHARGYTMWDPTSPPFLMTDVNGLVSLNIPSVFVSWQGLALCGKTQLLRSRHIVSRQVVRFLKLLGDKTTTKVSVTLGPEQEYFLIDKEFYAARPDLRQCGRTLIGALPIHAQQFEDHYWGHIPDRVISLMNEVEEEMLKLGIPAKVRHNEVAPAQFEIAPLFEGCNLASDHNALTMDILTRVALRHDFVCLFHEKPFAGLNGSGKHHNWSLSTQDGDNLLSPGSEPEKNIRFLCCCLAVLKAVHDHSKIFRFASVSPGNDHRLGGQEAPPAIISAFLGKGLTDALSYWEGGCKEASFSSKEAGKTDLSLGEGMLPLTKRDRGDRNRSSPFAFTGNRWEFRMVGGPASCAVATSYMNAAMADAFSQLSARLEKKLATNMPRADAVKELICELIQETKPIRYEGNCYEKKFLEEAEKRGLPNLRNTPEVIAAVRDESVYDFMVKLGVLTKAEFEARRNIILDQYIKQVDMEAELMQELVRSHVKPAIEKEFMRRQAALKMCPEVNVEEVSSVYTKLKQTVTKLAEEHAVAKKIPFDLGDGIIDELKRAKILAETILPLMYEVRTLCDFAEKIVADEYWTLPKYSEMLYMM